MDDIGWIDIIKGVVSGVGSGIVLAVAIYGLDRWKIYRERRVQVAYLARLIQTEREEIHKIGGTLMQGMQINNVTDSLRKPLIGTMVEKVDMALSVGLSGIADSEKIELRNVLVDFDKKRKIGLIRAEVYDKTFIALESMGWLHLPKGPYFSERNGNKGNAR